MINKWKKIKFNEFMISQKIWKLKKNNSSYIRFHSYKSIKLNVENVIDVVRMLRVCNDLLFLVIISFKLKIKTKMRWINQEVREVCMNIETKCIKTECSLNKIYVVFIKTCSKLAAIKYIFSKEEHRDKSALIMFIFSKMTLIVERISRFFEIRYFILCFWSISYNNKHILFCSD